MTDTQRQQDYSNREHQAPLTSTSDRAELPGLAGLLARIMRDIPGTALDAPDDARPSCGVCGDTRFVHRSAEDWRLTECKCQAPRVEERRRRHWETTSGVPERFRVLRLAQHPNLIGGNPGLLERLTSADHETSSWFLWGDYGRGKTGIAAAYAWDYLHATGESVLFRTLPDLLGELRATYDRGSGDDEGGGPVQLSEAELLARYQHAGLLILDDLGAEQLRQTGDNTWAADRLYQVIGKRHAEQRPMILTSNLSLPEVGRRLGERITARIYEMCGRQNVVQVQGRNLRVV